MAARETAQALKTLAQAARGVAASTGDPAGARAMLDSAWDVMEGSALLIQEAKQALVSPGDAESQQRLAQVGGGQPEAPQERRGLPLALLQMPPGSEPGKGGRVALVACPAAAQHPPRPPICLPHSRSVCRLWSKWSSQNGAIEAPPTFVCVWLPS